jgi:hypothetical protein
MYKMDKLTKESFICDNINDLTIQFRKDILQMIHNSHYRSKLKEKGNGTQIKIDELSDSLVNKIFTFMNQKLDDQKIDIL